MYTGTPTQDSKRTVLLTQPVRRILNLAARLWRHDNGLTWLDTPPLIQTSQELIKSLKDPVMIEATLEAVECMGSTIDFLKASVEMMEAAQNRLLWAFNEVYKDEIDRAAN